MTSKAGKLLLSWTLAAAGLAWVATAAAADKGPAGQFTGTATVQTPSGTRSMGVQIFVQRPMTVEEAQHLKQVLADGGQQALLNAIRGGNRGHFRFGAMDYPIDLVVAQESRDGFKYVIVTARPLKYEEVNEGKESLDHPFTVVMFEAPSFGSGSGEVYTKAALQVEGDGWVRVYEYGKDPGTLKDVKRK
ncbi:MAG TPA: hypothetical protein VKG01_13925 [Thermoanaerobaculia bacterium]|nr:hypothetical protein [Thermoanaerobaculia bacterium]